jgi:hypothetical protein
MGLLGGVVVTAASKAVIYILKKTKDLWVSAVRQRLAGDWLQQMLENTLK